VPRARAFFARRVRVALSRSFICIVIGFLLLWGAGPALGGQRTSVSGKFKSPELSTKFVNSETISQQVRSKRPDPTKPDTSDLTRESVVSAIPFEKLTPEARKQVLSIIEPGSIFRRMPVQVTRSDPEFYLFIIRNPDLLINIWEELDISELQMRKIRKNNFATRDGEGTVGTVRLIYQDQDTHIALAEGNYSGPLLTKPVEGRSLLIIKTGFVRDADGRWNVASRLDTFTRIDNVAFDALAKTFMPILGRVADSNFLQTSAFVGRLSQTAEVDQSGILRLTENCSHVDRETRLNFLKITSRMAEEATARKESGAIPVAWEMEASRATSERR
jgi:hypothetical protein